MTHEVIGHVGGIWVVLDSDDAIACETGTPTLLKTAAAPARAGLPHVGGWVGWGVGWGGGRAARARGLGRDASGAHQCAQPGPGARRFQCPRSRCARPLLRSHAHQQVEIVERAQSAPDPARSRRSIGRLEALPTCQALVVELTVKGEGLLVEAVEAPGRVHLGARWTDDIGDDAVPHPFDLRAVGARRAHSRSFLPPHHAARGTAAPGSALCAARLPGMPSACSPPSSIRPASYPAVPPALRVQPAEPHLGRAVVLEKGDPLRQLGVLAQRVHRRLVAQCERLQLPVHRLGELVLRLGREILRRQQWRRCCFGAGSSGRVRGRTSPCGTRSALVWLPASGALGRGGRGAPRVRHSAGRPHACRLTAGRMVRLSPRPAGPPCTHSSGCRPLPGE